MNRTRLDGAAIMTRDGAPIIGMTLRHDRVDNFWFTLCPTPPIKLNQGARVASSFLTNANACWTSFS